MPELPEVQTIVDDLNAAGLIGLPITGARVFWSRTIAEPSPQAFCRRIKGKEFTAVQRRGLAVAGLNAGKLESQKAKKYSLPAFQPFGLSAFEGSRLTGPFNLKPKLSVLNYWECKNET